MNEENLHTYLEALSSGEGAPGGGSATALVGALGAALSLMVSTIFSARSQIDVSSHVIEELHARANHSLQQLEELMSKDATSFDGVLSAYKLPKNTEEEKQIRFEKIEQGLLKATHSPLDMMKETSDVLDVLKELTSLKITGTIVNDIVVGTVFLKAALEAGYFNVRINTKMMKNDALQNKMNEQAYLLKVNGVQKAELISSATLHYLDTGKWQENEPMTGGKE